MGVHPHIESLDAWTGAGVRRVLPMSGLADAFGPTYERVSAAVEAAGARIVGPVYAEYFGMPSDVVDVEIGLGIDTEVEVAGLQVRTHPATRAVVATHVGPYERLSESYRELMPWLEMEEFELSDSMIEFYDSAPGTDPEHLVTRLVFPFGSSGRRSPA
ncbi:GyrI-like domain-containing protein [Propionicimonas sp.]|uniref:GyrI-like domain-containing protein n=1 Tax=Propionicimonas sp. TaxID=1955623 RepID=UPI0039E71B64